MLDFTGFVNDNKSVSSTVGLIFSKREHIKIVSIIIRGCVDRIDSR